MAWSHMGKIIRIFEKYGLIEREKKGRIKVIELTEKGKEIADGLIRIESILKRLKRENNIRQGSN